MTSTSEIPSRRRRSARVSSTARLGLGVERRGRLVEQQHPRLQRQRPGEHRPLLLADREPGAVAIGVARVEPGEVEQPVDVRLAPRRARRRSGCCRRPCPRAAPAAAAPARPRGAARAGRARARRRRGRGRSRRRGPRAGRAAAGRSTCPSPEGPAMQLAPSGSRALSSRSTGLPARARLTRRSSNAARPHAAIIGPMADSERMPRNLEPMLATPAKGAARRRRLGL